MKSVHARKRSVTRLRRVLAVGSALGLAVLLVGVTAGTASAARPAKANGRVSAATLASLEKVVRAAEAVPKFVAPGPPVKASVLRGKSALVMPINSEIDTCQHQAETFTSLGDSLGMHVTLFSDSGDPTQWIQGIDDATAARDSAIVLLCGIVPGAVAPQLQTAERDGIQVVDGNYNEVSNYHLLGAETAVQVEAGMKDDVAQALINLKGAPIHAILVTSDSVVQGPASIAAVKAEISTACGRICSLDETLNVPVQDWATQIQSDVGSALGAHADANAVIVAFDGMTTFVLPSVEAAHRAGLKIYTWGGSKSVEQLMLSKNSYVVADPGPDEAWDGYEAMDQVIRLLSHKPPASVNKEVDPNRFWVASNVRAFFGPHFSYGNGGFGGNAFVNGFRKLWGLKPIS